MDMDKFINEIALKAEDFSNSALSKCEQNTNPTTAALNANFALGEFFALMKIVKKHNIDLYVKTAISAQETVDKLTDIVNNIYSI